MIFPGNIKGLASVASAARHFTEVDLLNFRDENFNIPDDGISSDVAGLDEDDLDAQDGDFAMEAPDVDIVFVNEDDLEVNLAAVDIVENAGRGRPQNVRVADFKWSCERANIEISNFSQAVGPTKVMPDNSVAVDFFQLFVDNCIFGNIARETNRYACQSLEAKHKDPNNWKDVCLEELKAFLGLLIGMSIHRLPWLRDYWSSDWIQGIPTFSKIMSRDRFLAIWNNLHLSDNTQMPQPGQPDHDKLFKVREFLDDMKANFHLNNNPHREQAIDEAMIKYKGRTSLVHAHETHQERYQNVVQGRQHKWIPV